MTGLMSVPSTPLDPANAAVAADGWYPDYPLADLRERMRLGDGVVTTARATSAIEGAMLHAIKELADWKAAREAEGASALADVIDAQLAGMNLAELLWRRAIRYLAAAELATNHRDVSATPAALDRAAEKDESADAYRAQAWAAINDLRSIGAPAPIERNRVSLI